MDSQKPSWLGQIPSSLSDQPTHPSQVALRTYALALTLSLCPSLFPVVAASFTHRKLTPENRSALKRVFKRELSYDGFAFAMALSVGGGAALHYIWDNINTRTSKLFLAVKVRREQEMPKMRPGVKLTPPQPWEMKRIMEERLEGIALSPEQRTFVANVVASSVGILLLQQGRERISQMKQGHSTQSSPTLDLTLLFVVRALDSLVQSFIHARNTQHRFDSHHSAAGPRLLTDPLGKERRRQTGACGAELSTKIDALLFWACSARIMWCFFYEPQRLPRSYVKWINTLANVDSRLLKTLNLLREGKWLYSNCSPGYINFLKPYASDLGRPASWADPTIIPACGGSIANDTWNMLGVTSRPGVGGIPCELVHGQIGKLVGLSHSCVANTALRGFKAFLEAMAIYIPVHFLPLLLMRPRTLLRPHRFLQILLGTFRSATFLSTFVASYWFAVCFTRSLVLAKYLPFISHDFWDGPFGGMFVGSLVCGSSIWIERGKRRGEMALYVMPKALRTCFPDRWLNAGKRARTVECIAMILSLSTLLTAAVHRPESLRGLSQWTLSFIINGPNTGLWKRKYGSPSNPPAPSISNNSSAN